MTGFEVVVGFLVAWTARRAKHLGDGLGSEADQVLDKALEALHKLVSDKLGGDPAIARLDAEAEQDGDATSRTMQRVILSLEDAAERDESFARSLTALVNEAERADRVAGRSNSHSRVGLIAGTAVTTGSVVADGQGVAFGAVHGPVTVTQGETSRTCGRCSRQAIGWCLDCEDPLCELHNQAGRKRTIATRNPVDDLTVLQLWAAASDKVICGDCLTKTENDLLRSLPLTPLPSDPKPVVRLIELADRSFWSQRQRMDAWMDALLSASGELGGNLAVFDAAAAAVLNRTEVTEFRVSQLWETFEGAVAGEEMMTYAFEQGHPGLKTGRLLVVNHDLDWFFVHKVREPDLYAPQPLPSQIINSVSGLVDLAIPALTDYVHYPKQHDLMPDLWAEGMRSCTCDWATLSSVLKAHRWPENG